MAKGIDTGAPPRTAPVFWSRTARLVLRSILENAGYRIELADSASA